MLEDLYPVFTRMLFKLAMSQNLVLEKGKVENHFHFKVGGQATPTFTEKPVKTLGKCSTAASETPQVYRRWLRKWREEQIVREVKDMDLSAWSATKIVVATVGV